MKVLQVGTDGYYQEVILNDYGTFNAFCTAIEQVGDWIYIKNNATKTVAAAKADNPATSLVKGIIISKSTDFNCVVQTDGIVFLSGLTEGTRYFLSATVAGAMTTTIPASGTGHIVRSVGTSLTSTEFLIDDDPTTTIRHS